MKLNTLYRGLLMMLLALTVGFGSVSSPASAQTASQPPAAGICAEVANISFAERYFGVCEVVPGMRFSSADWEQLRTHGVLVKAAFNQERIDRAAARHGWRSDEVAEAIDDVSTEGNTISVYVVEGGTIFLIRHIKGVDVAQNGMHLAAWTMAGNSNGNPVFNQLVYNENWQSIFSKIAGQTLGQLVSGVGTVLADNATQPGCNGSCGGPAAVAYAISGAEANAFIEQTTTGTPGTCPTGTTCTGPPWH